MNELSTDGGVVLINSEACRTIKDIRTIRSVGPNRITGIIRITNEGEVASTRIPGNMIKYHP